MKQKSIILVFTLLILLITVGGLGWLIWERRELPRLLSTAQRLTAAGDFMEAADFYARVLARDPDHVESLVALAGIAREEGNFTTAAKLWARIRKLDPQSASAVESEALNWLAVGDHERALQVLGEVADPKLFDRQPLLLAKALLQAGRIEDAVAAIASAPDKEDVSVLLCRADIAFASGANPGHVHDLYKALEADPAVASAALVGLGNCAMRQGDGESAQAYFQEAWVKSGTSFQCGRILGDFLQDAGQFEQALDVWTELYTKFPDSVHVQLALAEAYLALGSADPLCAMLARQESRPGPLGVRFYSKALLAQAESRFEDVFRNLQWAREIAGQRRLFQVLWVEGACRQRNNAELARGLSMVDVSIGVGNPKFAALLEQVADSASRAWLDGDRAFARAAALQVLQRDAEFVKALALLARIEMEEGNYPRSAALAEKILSRSPQDPAALEVRGRSRMMAGEVSSAIDDFNRLSAALPGSYLGPFWLGIASYQGEDYEQAVSLLSDAWEKNPRSAQIAAAYFDALRKVKDGEGIRSLSDALVAGDDFLLQSIGYCFHAGLAMDEGDKNRAIDNYLLAIEKAPHRIPYYLEVGSLLQDVGDNARALTFIEEAKRRAPENRYVLFERARCLEALGRSGEAVEQYRSLLRRFPSWAIVVLRLSDVLATQPGMSSEALALAREGVSLASNWGEAHFTLAQRLFEAGQIEESKAALSDALAISPDDHEYLEFRDALEGKASL